MAPCETLPVFCRPDVVPQGEDPDELHDLLRRSQGSRELAREAFGVDTAASEPRSGELVGVMQIGSNFPPPQKRGSYFFLERGVKSQEIGRSSNFNQQIAADFDVLPFDLNELRTIQATSGTFPFLLL